MAVTKEGGEGHFAAVWDLWPTNVVLYGVLEKSDSSSWLLSLSEMKQATLFILSA